MARKKKQMFDTANNNSVSSRLMKALFREVPTSPVGWRQTCSQAHQRKPRVTKRTSAQDGSLRHSAQSPRAGTTLERVRPLPHLKVLASDGGGREGQGSSAVTNRMQGTLVKGSCHISIATLCLASMVIIGPSSEESSMFLPGFYPLGGSFGHH